MLTQIGRFLVSGGAAVTVDFATFLLLRSLGIPLVIANSVGFSLAFGTGFLLNRRWTFEAVEGHVGRQLVRYGAVAAAGLLLNTIILLALVSLGLPEIVAKAAATVGSAALNFVLSRVWVFV